MTNITQDAIMSDDDLLFDFGFGANVKSHDMKLQALTWSGFIETQQVPEIRENKDGPYVCCGQYNPPRAEARAWKGQQIIVIDGDGHISTETGKKVSGADKPESIAGVMAAMGLRFCLVTSHSHSAPDYGNRWRLFVVSDRLVVTADELIAAARSMHNKLRLAGCIVAYASENHSLARLWFKPACPANREAEFRFFQGEGELLCVNEAMDWYQDQLSQQQLTRNRYESGAVGKSDFDSSDSLGDWYASNMDFIALLENANYTSATEESAGNWRLSSPYDDAEVKPGVLVRCTTDGFPYVVSRHQGCNDPLEYGSEFDGYDSKWSPLKKGYAPITALGRLYFNGDIKLARNWVTKIKKIATARAKLAQIEAPIKTKVGDAGFDAFRDVVEDHENAYQLARVDTAKKLGITVSALDAMCKDWREAKTQITQVGELHFDESTLVPEAMAVEGNDPCVLALDYTQSEDNDCQSPLNKNHTATWPPGIFQSGGGLFGIPDEAEKPPLYLCGAIEVLALARDLHGLGWGPLLKWNDQDGVTHTEMIPRATLAGDSKEGLRVLIDGGLDVAMSAKRLYLLRYALGSVTIDCRARTVESPGWHGDVYVYGTRVIGGSGEEQLLWSGSQGEHYFYSSGTLEEWMLNVAVYAEGNSRLVLGICMGLAGALLPFYPQGKGGIHLEGRSSTGKTSVADATGSTMGGYPTPIPGRQGYVSGWNSTAVGIEGTARRHNHSCLVLDELGTFQGSAQQAGGVIYEVSNGLTKGRGNVDGSARKRKNFDLLLLSTGEITLDNMLTRDGGTGETGGQAVRLLNLSAIPSKSPSGEPSGVFENLHGMPGGAEFSNLIKSNSCKYYGTALPAFVEGLTRMDRKDIIVAVKDAVMALHIEVCREFDESQVPAQVGRMLDRLGLIAAAGVLAEQMGVVPWRTGETIDAMRQITLEWLQGRDGLASAEESNTVALVRRYLNEERGRFQPLYRHSTNGTTHYTLSGQSFHGKRTGWIKDGDFIIPVEVFDSSVLPAGVNPKTARKALFDAGFLVCNPGRHTHNVKIPDDCGGILRTINAIHIKGGILGDMATYEDEILDLPTYPSVDDLI